ncbi:MAG: MATE family efflux transporter [Desulfobacteraceae bacterium]
MNRIIKRWKSEGGYKDLLNLAIPLIVSTGTVSVYYFIDRMFLAWHSAEAIAAAMPASMVSQAFMSFFLGIASYTSVFVAQYFGAGKYNRVGPVIWQGIYISILGGILLIGLIPFAKTIFSFFGHEQLVQQEEITYFRVLCFSGVPALSASAISGYFSGRGRPWPVMWVNCTGTGINLVLDYAFIFGNWGFPELGIKGAGIATVIASTSTLCIFLFLISTGSQNKTFHTLKGWRPDVELLKRILRFGLPAGTNFFLDMASFTIFLLILGRLGTVSLVASNIAFNINSLAFMPMIGCGNAVSVLVGQFLGKGQPDLAEKSSYSGLHLTFIYMVSISIAYVTIPELFIAPFAAKADPSIFGEISGLSVKLLRFVAVYSLFDTLNIIFSSSLKGAGDTKFVMFMTVTIGWLIMVIPTYISIVVLDYGIMACWICATLFVITLGIGFTLRFLNGKWKSMLVIERTD